MLYSVLFGIDSIEYVHDSHICCKILCQYLSAAFLYQLCKLLKALMHMNHIIIWLLHTRKIFSDTNIGNFSATPMSTLGIQTIPIFDIDILMYILVLLNDDDT